MSSIAVTPNQIERLYSRFTSLDRSDCGTLSREDFLRIPELAINPLCDRIVHAFFAESMDDSRVNFRQFMKVLAHFRQPKKNRPNKLNSRTDKLRFAFNVSGHLPVFTFYNPSHTCFPLQMYDLDDDNSISRDELLSILQMMVGDNIGQEQLISIAERTILEGKLIVCRAMHHSHLELIELQLLQRIKWARE